MNDEHRTIVGGRSRSNKLVGDIPRGIEILLKKASVDPDFYAFLLQNPLGAARSIELDLKPVEKSILNNIDEHILQKMIASTRVPKQHIKSFRTAKTAAVLIFLLSSTMVMAGGETEGMEPMPAWEVEQIELAEAKMSSVQNALEAYKMDSGRYPETSEWLDTPGPLSEYLSQSDLFDPWKRKFHYEAVMEDGKIVNYKLESLGLDPEYPYDNIPCPLDPDEHLFSGEDY